jgi:hypothetical protein
MQRHAIGEFVAERDGAIGQVRERAGLCRCARHKRNARAAQSWFAANHSHPPIHPRSPVFLLPLSTSANF